jgi:hypothetical protein
MTHEFKEGCMWEGDPWSIEASHECSGDGGGRPCRHCHSFTDKVHKRYDGSTFTEIVWVCPRVVVARNEAGHNSTGVCLDCILDAERSI